MNYNVLVGCACLLFWRGGFCLCFCCCFQFVKRVDLKGWSGRVEEISATVQAKNQPHAWVERLNQYRGLLGLGPDPGGISAVVKRVLYPPVDALLLY